MIHAEDTSDSDVTIFRTEKNTVEVISMDKYIKGVLAYYLNNDFHEETFKAMAVLIRSYAYYYSSESTGHQKEDHPQYQLCDDERCCLGYTDDLYHQTKFPYESTVSSLNMADYSAKINRAVEETRNEVAAYNGEVILPHFFYASWGATESNSTVNGIEVKYLVSVQSNENAPEPFGKSVKEYNSEDFILLMKSYYPDIILTKSKLKEQIKILQKNASGSIADIMIGDKQFQGKEISSALGLNSNSYEVSITSTKVIFTVYGYGDGVGLSLYGADYLAKSRSKYDKILKHYFYGVSVIHYDTNK